MSGAGASLLVGVITFNPGAEAADRVTRQLSSLSGVGPGVVVDNSTDPDARTLVRDAARARGLPVLGDGVNRGTAGGLNILLALARRQGVDWVLYFDQDSRPSAAYAHVAGQLAGVPTDVAVVGSHYEVDQDVTPGAGLEEVRYLIASGSCYRSEALRQVDGFDEAFFLDLVDHEICLRLRRRGWRLMRAGDLVLTHSIGEGADARIGRVTVRRHPGWRRRLMWRNGWWWLWREGPRGLGEPARSLGIRAAETLVSAGRLRSWGYLTAAVGGTVDAVTLSGRRRGLRASDAEAVVEATYPHPRGSAVR